MALSIKPVPVHYDAGGGQNHSKVDWVQDFRSADNSTLYSDIQQVLQRSVHIMMIIRAHEKFVP